jgi:electron transfer flavoprotein alpha subunit
MVLVFTDHSDAEIKKSSYEVLSYGAALAQKLGVSAEALLLGTVKDDLSTWQSRCFKSAPGFR